MTQAGFRWNGATATWDRLQTASLEAPGLILRLLARGYAVAVDPQAGKGPVRQRFRRLGIPPTPNVSVARAPTGSESAYSSVER